MKHAFDFPPGSRERTARLLVIHEEAARWKRSKKPVPVRRIQAINEWNNTEVLLFLTLIHNFTMKEINARLKKYKTEITAVKRQVEVMDDDEV